MKPEEDIGSLIKSKLQSAERASNKPTWERIQHSLEERRKKRRLAFYIKLGSAGLLLIISALFLFNYIINTEDRIVSQEEIHIDSDLKKENNLEKNEESQNTTSQTTVAAIDSISSSEIHNLTDQKIIKTDVTVSNAKDLKSNVKVKSENPKEKEITATVTTKNKEQEAQITSLKEVNDLKVSDTVVNRNDVPVTQTTQKMYYYYNSKNGQEVSSTDKKVIDSIIKANEKKQDSLKLNN